MTNEQGLLAVLRFRGRPPTMNGYRSKHWRYAQAQTDNYRNDAGWSIKGTDKPGEELWPLSVDAYPTYETRRSLPDTGACFPAVKAAIDGLVDAGWIPDDTPDIIGEITFHAPYVGNVPDGLIIHISTLAGQGLEP